jgi:hypothetical protein
LVRTANKRRRILTNLRDLRGKEVKPKKMQRLCASPPLGRESALTISPTSTFDLSLLCLLHTLGSAGLIEMILSMSSRRQLKQLRSKPPSSSVWPDRLLQPRLLACVVFNNASKAPDEGRSSGDTCYNIASGHVEGNPHRKSQLRQSIRTDFAMKGPYISSTLYLFHQSL